MVDKDIIDGDFADGLRDFFTVGSLVKPVRLNKNMKAVILKIIQYRKENTALDYDEDDEVGYSMFMNTMTYLENRLGVGTGIKVRFDILIAFNLYLFVTENRDIYYKEPGFDDAMQWITNIWNKKYSQNSLVREYDEAIGKIYEKLKLK